MISRRRAIGLLGGSVVALAAPRVLALAASRIVTDSAGRRIAIPPRAERIFAAGPPAAATLYTLVPDRLLGWPTPLAAAQRQYLPEKYAALPVTGRLTGHGDADAANRAAVDAARPDLIIDIGSVTPGYAALADRLQAQTGTPYLLLDGALSRTPTLYRLLGAMLGATTQAAPLAEEAERLLASARKAGARIPEASRVRVYYARRSDGLQTGIAGSLNAELIDLVGGRNVATVAARGNLATVSHPQIRAWNPDAIVTVDRDFYRGIGRNPFWSDLRAVRANRVFLSPDGPFGWFDEPPAANRLIGLPWLGGALYPGRFPDDLRVTATRFYRRFYHLELSPSRLDALLARRASVPNRG